MNEESEIWRAHRQAGRERAKERRSEGAARILALADEGHSVQRLTDCHYRIDGVLDLYPTNGKWHNLKTGARGRYRDVDALVQRQAVALREGDD